MSLNHIFQLLLACIILVFYCPVCAQQSECLEYVKEPKHSTKKVKLIFDVTDLKATAGKLIKGELELSDSGLPLTLQLNFEFSNRGYSVASGDILTIHFKDGSRNEVIYSDKKSGSGKIVSSHC